MDPFGETAVQIDLEELPSWIVHEDEDLLVINKPGWVVCHPSKNGPCSSLVGACREYLGVERLHLVSRLDRETSGVVVLAKHRKMASICQQAFEKREVEKRYLVFLKGELEEGVTVDQPLARDMESEVFVKQVVREDRTAKQAKTHFEPILVRSGYTLASVAPHTGRKHQIRAHAEFLEKRVVGDKIYGPDDSLYLEFIEKGWTDRLDKALPMKRQGLHAWRLSFKTEGFDKCFEAPVPEDMLKFFEGFMQGSSAELESVLRQL